MRARPIIKRLIALIMGGVLAASTLPVGITQSYAKEPDETASIYDTAAEGPQFAADEPSSAAEEQPAESDDEQDSSALLSEEEQDNSVSGEEGFDTEKDDASQSDEIEEIDEARDDHPSPEGETGTEDPTATDPSSTKDPTSTKDPISKDPKTDEEFPSMATGYIDVPLDVQSVHDLPENAVEMLSAPSESYYVTPNLPALRNQNPYGSCWAHSALSLAEINMMKDGRMDNADFSELHLTYFSYHTVNDPLGGLEGDSNANPKENYIDAGGNTGYAQNILASWTGATDEELAPYPVTTDRNYIPPAPSNAIAFEDAAHLKNYYNVDYYTSDNKPDVDLIKTLVKETGAVSISFQAAGTRGEEYGAYYDPTDNAYYNPTDLDLLPSVRAQRTNHAVTIVGWDDNFSKSKFNRTPEKNGAWLIRNSWTTSSAYKDSYYGYFWMSYYESTIGPNVTAAEYDTADNYDNNYQYDGTVINASSGYSKGANVFVAHSADGTGGESLKAASFATDGSNFTYTVDIYTDLTDDLDPESGQKSASVTGSAIYPGYYTVPLPQAVYLQPGTKFSVVVTLSKDGASSKPMIYSEWGADYWIKCVAHGEPGQSFVKSQYGWIDYGKSSGNGHNANLRIKAFTDNVDSPDIIYPDSVEFDGNISETGIELGYGEEYKIVSTILPADATRKKLTWKSSNTSVATVNNGIVKGVKKGSAVITATTANGKTASCTVTVINKVVSVTLKSPFGFDMINVGQSGSIRYSVTPTSADIRDIRWSSSDTSILTVDNYGKVTCVGVGEAAITLTIDGRSSSVTLSCSPAAPVPELTTDDDGVVTISWNAASCAESYQVWRGSYEEKLTTIVSDGRARYTFTDDSFRNLTENKTVEYYITSNATGRSGGEFSAVSSVLYAYLGPGNKYEITYNCGEGTNSPANPSVYSAGNLIILKNPTPPVGYKFMGWYEDAGYNTAKNSISENESGDKTFYARYAGVNYTVLYYGNIPEYPGIGLEPSFFVYGTEGQLREGDFLRAGYDFKEWNTRADGTGTSYASKQKVKNLVSEEGGHLALYAQWKPYSYKISFDPKGGKMENITLGVVNGEPYGELPKPVKDGYIFKGWFTEAYGGEEITADTIVDVYKNTKLYAQWLEYRLAFDASLPTVARKGDVIALKATLIPADADAGSVSWEVVSGGEYGTLTSSDPDPVTDAADWSFTCTGPGTVTLKAYMSKKPELCAERIIDIIRPMPDTLDIYDGDTVLTEGGSEGNAECTIGVIMHLRAVISPDDADERVIWSSNDDSVARVSMTGEVEPLKPGNAVVKAVSVADPTLSRKVSLTILGGAPRSIDINVDDEGAEANIGESIRLKANVYPAYSSDEILWTSSDTSKARVDDKGNVTALSAGDVVIYAKSVLDGSVSAEYKLTVRDITASAAAAVEADTVKLALGKSISLKPGDLLAGYDKSKDRVVWESDNASIAVVTSAGKVTGKSVGDVKIKLINETDGSTVIYPITVYAPVSSITLNTKSLNLGTGNKAVLSVTSIAPTMASDKVIWESSVPSVATVDETGLVTALSQGKTVITVRGADGGGKTAKCTVKVGSPVSGIKVTGAKGADSVTVGKTLKMSAVVNGYTSVTGKKQTPANKAVRWEVTDDRTIPGLGRAEIDSKGVLRGISEGPVTVRAYSTTDRYPNDPEKYICGEMDVAVTPDTKDTTIDIALNKASATQNIKISAGTSKLIRISSKGKLAKDEGIEWKIVSGSEYVSISEAYGEEITVTGKKATPSGTYAIVEAYTLGTNTKGVHYKKTCKISVGEEACTVRLMSGKTDVTGTTKELALRKSLSLKASVFGADGSTKAGNQKVKWRSSDTSVAAVSDKGKITAVSNGEAVIYASSSDNMTVVGQITIDVYTPVSKITLDKTRVSLSTGSSYEGYTSSDNRYEILTPSLTPSDVYGNITAKDDLKTVIWTVSDPAKVRVAVTDTGSVGTEKSTAAKIRILSRLEYRELADGDKAVGTSTVRTGPGQSLAIMAVGTGSVKITAVAYGGRKAACTMTIYTTARALAFKQTGGLVQDGEDYSAALSLTNKAYAKSVTLKPMLDYADAAYSSGKNDPLTKLYNSVKKFSVNSAVNYVSADPSVASVSAKGVITAKGKGETVITASTADGGHARKINVTVDKWEYGVFLNYEGPMEALYDYDTVVIDAQYIDAADIAAFRAAGHKVYSYINVGALENFREYYDEYKDLGLGVYENWEDEVWIDVSDPRWQEFILGEASGWESGNSGASGSGHKGLASMLAAKGIDGYFVDNCDVYYFQEVEGAQKPGLLGGLTDIMKGLKATGLKVIINGGDAFMDAYCAHGGAWSDVIDGINQETVFSKINWNKKDSFGRASEEDLAFFKGYVEKYGALGADIYLLEYTKDKKLIATVYEYCIVHGEKYKYYASPRLDLTLVK